MQHAVARLGIVLIVAIIAGCASGSKQRATGGADAISTAPAALPDGVKAALMAAEFAWEDGRHASAARHLARASALSDEPLIAERAARAAVIARDWPLARTSIERWRALAPDAVGLIQLDGAFALGLGDLATARARFDALLALDRDDARNLVAQALLQSQAVPSVIALLRDWLNAPALAGGAPTLVMLAEVAQQRGDLPLAEALSIAAVTRYPDALAAWTWRGRLALQQQRSREARDAFQRALALAPEDRTLRLTWAAVLNELEDHAAAARALDPLKPDDEVLAARAAYAARSNDKALIDGTVRALEALPEPRPSARLSLLGQMSELAGDYEAALGWYAEVPDSSDFADAQFRRAIVLDGLGREAEAYAVLDQLRAGGIADDTTLERSFLLEAEIALANDALDRAEDAYTRALAVLPMNPELRYGRALLLIRRGDTAGAIALLERLVDEAPDNAVYLNALGYTLADAGLRLPEALAFIERALEQDPDSAAILDSKGWVLFRLGRTGEAVEWLERAYTAEPNAEIGAHWGEALWALGRRADAEAVWAKAAKLDADNAALGETIRRLTGRAQ